MNTAACASPGRPTHLWSAPVALWVVFAGGGPQAGDTVSLFASYAAVVLTLAADFHAIRKDRSDDPDDRPALLVLEDGDTLAVELRPRGNFRRDPAVCSFPPLRLDVKTESAEGTVFQGQDKLKIVLPCRPEWDSYEELVLREMLLYKVYALFTPASFKVRLARITFVDTSGEREPFTRPAFFIENDEALALRVGGQVLDIPDGKIVRKELLDPRSSTRVAIFQYLIGNTDWADARVHNVLILGLDGRVVPVPYDFDFAGAVGAPYATPAPDLPIVTVQQRLYRGHCWREQDEAEALAPFLRARTDLEALVRGFTPLAPAARDDTLEYLLHFYEQVATPQRAHQMMFRDCVPL